MAKRACGVGPSADTPSIIEQVGPDGKPTGGVCWNGDKDYQRWLWVSGLGPNASFPVALAAFPGTTNIAYNVSPDGQAGGDLEVCLLNATPVAPGLNFAVLLSDSRSKRQYMNVPICSNLVYGIASWPSALASTLYIPATNALQAAITSLTSSPQTLSTSVFGRRFVDRRGAELEANRRAAFFSRKIHPYWLGPNGGPEFPLQPAAALAVGASAVIQMTVPSDARFDATLLLDDSTGSFSVQIFDGASGRAFMDQPLPREHVFVRTFPAAPAIGQAAIRYCTWSQSFVPGSTIAFNVTNTDSSPIRLRIAVHGRLLYVQDNVNALPPGSRAIPVEPGPYAPSTVPGDCVPRRRSRPVTDVQRSASPL